MATPTIKLRVKTSGQDGFDIADARVTARLTTPVVYQGFILPKSTVALTNGTGECVLELWPNELGLTMSQYQIKIQDVNTGKTFTVYAYVPDRDCNLWEITDMATGLVLPDGVIGVPGAAATIRVGAIKSVPYGEPAKVTNVGSFNHAVFDFELPTGANGAGTMRVGSVTTLPPGSDATVVNVGTDDNAILNFGIPGSAPSNGGGTVVTEEIYITLLPWETEDGGVVTPPFVPLLDDATQAAYAAAIQAAAIGGKRLAGANALISAFGNEQRLTIKRNGTTVVTLHYAGALPLLDDGTRIGVRLSTLSSASAISASDINTGTWTAVLSGGSGYARTASLTVGPAGSGKHLTLTRSPAPGMGIRPSFVLVAPRSVDGLQ